MANYFINAKVKVDSSSVQSQLSKIKPQPIKLDIDTSKTKQASTGIDGITKSSKEASRSILDLGGSFTTTLAKVGKFFTITKIVQTFAQTIDLAVKSVKEFDDAQTEFKKVSDLTGSSLDNYTKKLGELGSEVARTRTEMVSSATEFKKSGFTDEQSAQLAKTAELYRNVADSQISSGDASSYVISQMKAFNITANDSSKIIDKTNEVSNRFSVSSTDISSALTKTSSSLATYGNTIDQTMGLVVAGTEIMTNQAGKVGRGLRSVGANIVKMANDTGVLTYQIGGATKSISLFDKTTGEMRNTYDVLKEISQNWDKMSTAEKSALAVNLAGKQGSCSYRFNCWKLLKSLILNYNSNIISGKFNKFETVTI